MNLSEPTVDKQLPIKEIISIFLFVGGLVTSWVNLNNSLAVITIKQEEAFKYVEKQLAQLEADISAIRESSRVGDVKLEDKIRRLEEEYNDLDKMISNNYQNNQRSKSFSR